MLSLLLFQPLSATCLSGKFVLSYPMKMIKKGVCLETISAVPCCISSVVRETQLKEYSLVACTVRVAVLL